MLLLAALVASAASARAQPGMISPADWSDYAARFVDPSGRVIDDANGRISHSEGQGYGMLLAYLAGDKAGFERIWTFTRTELLIRDDGLAAWRWDPNADPHVTDINVASDGDLLIAYALALAAQAWNVPDYERSAARIAQALGQQVIRREGGRLVLLPGATGFSVGERPDGPVLNLSYWIFEAFPVLARLAPEVDWDGLAASGRELLSLARLGPARLPPDWISAPADGPLEPAEGFEPVFGYNSLRIVLYLLRAGIADTDVQKAILNNWMVQNGGMPAIVNIPTGKALARLSEPGYRMLAATLACAIDGSAIPADLRRLQPSQYYPSTLYLLSLSLVGEKYPTCLR
ncbi:glycosyl hydrolase family 8 [Ancylobacter rudongensis]|uniref:cellulase n=1 Tax=Ancylobacter rudongensis TaxID=177413 RepID=A0A1G4TA39_9HYPH|nr:glycosyl hydrolase family 8 [Ancylobacter rudongensis]SCW77605.1 endoglucanase [Ancylobacter rudongensis]